MILFSICLTLSLLFNAIIVLGSIFLIVRVQFFNNQKIDPIKAFNIPKKQSISDPLFREEMAKKIEKTFEDMA